MATTIANAPTYRSCYFAQLDGLAGTLAKLDDNNIYFFHQESGMIREVTSYAGLVVLGEVGVSMAQMVLDEMRGGLARVACTREHGRQ
jgi:hypothetical protein